MSEANSVAQPQSGNQGSTPRANGGGVLSSARRRRRLIGALAVLAGSAIAGTALFLLFRGATLFASLVGGAVGYAAFRLYLLLSRDQRELSRLMEQAQEEASRVRQVGREPQRSAEELDTGSSGAGSGDAPDARLRVFCDVQRQLPSLNADAGATTFDDYCTAWRKRAAAKLERVRPLLAYLIATMTALFALVTSHFVITSPGSMSDEDWVTVIAGGTWVILSGFLIFGVRKHRPGWIRAVLLIIVVFFGINLFYYFMYWDETWARPIIKLFSPALFVASFGSLSLLTGYRADISKAVPSLPIRRWRDTTTGNIVLARLTWFDETCVELERDDKQRLRLALDQLSQEDREYITTLRAYAQQP